MRAVDGFLAVFAEGHEHVKALVTVVADIVIGWHVSILTESGSGVERSFQKPTAVHNGHSTGLDMGRRENLHFLNRLMDYNKERVKNSFSMLK